MHSISHLRRQSNLRVLTQALLDYANTNNGTLPEPWQWHGVMDPWLGIERSDLVYGQSDIGELLMLPLPWSDGMLPLNHPVTELANLPVMFEDPCLHPDRTAVAFWDGTVRLLDHKEFGALIDQTKAVRLGRPEP